MEKLMFLSTAEELASIVNAAVRKAFDTNESKIVEGARQDEILNIDQACKLLGVSKVSVHDWKKKGLIPFHRLGGRIFFMRSEIIGCLRKIDLSRGGRDFQNEGEIIEKKGGGLCTQQTTTLSSKIAQNEDKGNRYGRY